MRGSGKEMETTIEYSGYIGIMEKKMGTIIPPRKPRQLRGLASPRNHPVLISMTDP